MARALALVVIVLACLAAAGDKPVSIDNRFRFVPDSGPVRYQVRVQPHAENRQLVFSAIDQADGNVVRSSSEDLDGDQAPRTRWFAWRLPAGDLLLVAQLFGVNGRSARDTQSICVYSLSKPCGQDEQKP